MTKKRSLYEELYTSVPNLPVAVSNKRLDQIIEFESHVGWIKGAMNAEALSIAIELKEARAELLQLRTSLGGLRPKADRESMQRSYENRERSWADKDAR
jgi:hypothetical protein